MFLGHSQKAGDDADRQLCAIGGDQVKFAHGKARDQVIANLEHIVIQVGNAAGCKSTQDQPTQTAMRVAFFFQHRMLFHRIKGLQVIGDWLAQLCWNLTPQPFVAQQGVDSGVVKSGQHAIVRPIGDRRVAARFFIERIGVLDKSGIGRGLIEYVHVCTKAQGRWSMQGLLC